MKLGEYRSKLAAENGGVDPYADLTDVEFASRLHEKHYSDIPLRDFYSQVGLGEHSVPAAGHGELGRPASRTSRRAPVDQLSMDGMGRESLASTLPADPRIASLSDRALHPAEAAARDQEDEAALRRMPGEIAQVAGAMYRETGANLRRGFENLNAQAELGHAERSRSGALQPLTDEERRFMTPSEIARDIAVQTAPGAEERATQHELNAARMGRQARYARLDMANALPPEAGQGERATVQGVASTLFTAPVVTAGALVPGGAPVALTTLGGASGLNRYYELVDQGVPEEAAVLSATLLGGLESLTEAIPLGTLAKKSPFIRQASEFVVQDLLGENVMSVAQIADDFNLGLRDDVTMQDIQDALRDTTTSTVVGAGAQVSIAQITRSILERANQAAAARAPVMEDPGVDAIEPPMLTDIVSEQDTRPAEEITLEGDGELLPGEIGVEETQPSEEITLDANGLPESTGTGDSGMPARKRINLATAKRRGSPPASTGIEVQEAEHIDYADVPEPAADEPLPKTGAERRADFEAKKQSIRQAFTGDPRRNVVTLVPGENGYTGIAVNGRVRAWTRGEASATALMEEMQKDIDAAPGDQQADQEAELREYGPRPPTFSQRVHEAATSPKNDRPEPSHAQMSAGNYKKGHVRVHGMDISIENPIGSIRRSKPDAPVQWERKITKGHYGYIRGTEDNTGEHVDVFVGPNKKSPRVYVIDQVIDGKFDEPKVMLGYLSEEAARKAYLANYQKGWKGLGAMTEMNVYDFKKWVTSRKAKEPVSWVSPRDSRIDARADRLKHMASRAGWQEIGGRVITDGDKIKPTVKGRTSWLPHEEWFRLVQQEAPLSNNKDGRATERAVEKAIAGEKLTAAEDRHIKAMLDTIDAEDRELAELAGQMEEDPDQLSDAELNALEAKLERLAKQHAEESEDEPDVPFPTSRRGVTSDEPMFERKDAKTFDLFNPPSAPAPAKAEQKPEAPKRGPGVQNDLFGGANEVQQALERVRAEKDRRRNSGQESTETGRKDDLFSQASKQADIEDKKPSQESLITRAPTGGDQAKPQPYASGMSRKGDLAAALETDVGVGTVITELSKAGMNQVAEAIKEGKDVFVDSGAFSAFKAALKTGRGRETRADFDEVLDRYDELAEMMREASFLSRWGAMFVAPDIVGNQTGTLELLEQHAERVKNWMEMGIEVVVPFQKGPLKQSEMFDRVEKILGGHDFVVGIPSNAEALSSEDLAELLRNRHRFIDRLHVLGAVNSRRMDERMAVIREEYLEDVPGVTADANLIRSKMDQVIGLSGKDRADAIKKIIAEATGSPQVEQVQQGEKGQERYRTDKRIKKYLMAKRPHEPDRIINYRTESVLAVRQAMEDGADQDVIDFLKGEYEWALEQLEKHFPETDWRHTLRRKDGEPPEGGPVPIEDEGDAEETSEPDAVTVQSVLDFNERLRAGDVALDEFRAMFEKVVQAKDALRGELEQKTKDELLAIHHDTFRRNEKKDWHVRQATEQLISQFAVGKDSISFVIGGSGYADSYAKAIRKNVENVTAEDLAAYAAKVKQQREEHAAMLAGIDNPQTLDEFKDFIRYKGESKLTAEQMERFDALNAADSKEKLKAAKERRERERSQVQSAGQTVGAKVIPSTHTKHGYAIYVVQMAERVARDVYDKLNTAAKQLGGYYSSYRGGGAIPGFTFREQDKAEAFAKLLETGDTAAASEVARERRDEYQDDKSQSTVERLRAMADRLEESAQESLNADRKTNTARRANMANRAEAQARANQQFARTMRNIADAIESGKADFLEGVRTKAQIEMLGQMLRTAHYDQIVAESKAQHGEFRYQDQINREGERPTRETARHVRYPRYSIRRGDLAQLGRELVEVHGAKQLGQAILKSADDVTTKYEAWVKDNLLRVALATESGNMAVFPTKAAAEAARKRSPGHQKMVTVNVGRARNHVVLSPREAQSRGLWQGDEDKTFNIGEDMALEIIEKVNAHNAKSTWREQIRLPWTFEDAKEKRARLKAMGIANPSMLREAMREYIELIAEGQKADPIKQKMRELVGRRDVGIDFFPTPAGEAANLVAKADIREGMDVLEPSAGYGAIADAIREAGAEPDVVEMSSTLREILELKGYTIAGTDFTEYSGKQYDRIVMNPPFSNGMDIDHVRHAYSLLKPGGRIVAIMGQGAFFRSDKKATEFREWADSLGALDEELPEGTFLDPSLPSTTGVNARVIVIDKPDAPMAKKGLVSPKVDALPARAVRDEVNRILREFQTRPRLLVVDTHEQLPAALKQAIRERGGELGTQRALQWNGGIYLIASQYNNLADVLDTVIHETVVHFGLRTVLDPETHIAIVDGIARDQPEVVNRMGRLEFGDRYDPNNAFMRRIAAEEVLAYYAPVYIKGRELPSTLERWVKAFVDAIKAFIARLVGAKPDTMVLPADYNREAMNRIIDALETYLKKGAQPDYVETAAQAAMAETRTVQMEDGVRRPITNADGNLVADTVEQQRNFWRWFGDSKVVDGSGRPLVVYHGSPDARFMQGDATFKTLKQRYMKEDPEAGFFFAKDRRVASTYADDRRAFDYQNAEPGVVAAYLSLKNPKVIDWGGKPWAGGKIAEIHPIEQAKADGFDGLIVENVIDYYQVESKKPTSVYVAFKANQIKSSTNNVGSFDPNRDSVLFERAPPFFSALTRAAEQAKTAKAPAQQWIATLRNTQGVKEEEIVWSGVEDWLKSLGRPATRDELVSFLRANEVQVEEVLKGSGGTLSEAQQIRAERDSLMVQLTALGYRSEFDPYEGTLDSIHSSDGSEVFVYDGATWIEEDGTDSGLALPKEAEELATKIGELTDRYVNLESSASHEDEGGTRYKEWAMPGGDNYRELLLTMPPREDLYPVPQPKPLAKLPEGYSPIFDRTMPDRLAYGVLPPNQDHARPMGGRHPTAEAAMAEALKIVNNHRLSDWAVERDKWLRTSAFQSGHWDEPNILTHVRFDDRTDADGKRVLFIQEIQSDWHQAGRKKGYRANDALDEKENIRNKMRKLRQRMDPIQDDVSREAEWNELSRQYDELHRRFLRTGDAVPNAPLKTTWAEFAFKRMLRWAAENGFDRVAWTTGNQQNERYGLEQHLGAVEWHPHFGNPKVGVLVAYSKQGGHLWERTIERDEIADYVGDEVMQRLLEAAPSERGHRVEGGDLRTGGEGMRGFYDKMLPSMVSKLTKKWGGKVTTTNLGPTDKAAFDAYMATGGPQVVEGSDGFYVQTVNSYDGNQTVHAGPMSTRERAEQVADDIREEDRRTGLGPRVHSIDVTPQMRDAALAGLPMFQQSPSQVGQAIARQLKPGTPQRKGYAALADRIINVWNRKIGSKYGALGNLPEAKQYLIHRYRTLGGLSQVRELTKSIYDTFSKATAEDSKAIYEYLTTAGAQPDGIADEKVRAKAIEVKEMIDLQGQALVQAGLLSEESYEKYKDQYLPRLYLRHVLEQGSGGRMSGTGKRLSDMGYLKARKDIPEEVRQVILGEITDPAFLGSFAVSRVQRDLHIMNFLQTISQNAAWTPPQMLVDWDGRKVSPYWLHNEAKQLRKQADHMRPRPDLAAKARAIADKMDTAANQALEQLQRDVDLSKFEQIPDSARYGALRGLYVRKEIHEDLVGAYNFVDSSNMTGIAGALERTFGQGGALTKATQAWKTSKVALNFPSHIRNMVGNMMMLHMSGVPAYRLPDRLVSALNSVITKDRWYQIARKYGLEEATFANRELMRIRDEWVRLQKTKGAPWNRALAMLGQVTDTVGGVYQFEEALFKIMKLQDAMEREGMSEADAMIEAHKWVFDYSLVPRWVRYLRNAPFGVPFLSYTYFAAPRVLETAVRRPWKMLPYIALLYAMQEAFLHAWGGDDDDVEQLKKSFPDWMNQKGSMMLLPWKDANGNWQVLDWGYMVPWGQFQDTMIQASHGNFRQSAETLGILSGPIPDLVSVWQTGIDPFTQKPIAAPGDPAALQAKSYVTYMWGMAAPGFITDSGAMGKMQEAYGGKVNPRTGEPTVTKGQAWARLFGFNVYPVDPEKTRETNLFFMQKEIDEARMRLRQKLRDKNLDEAQRVEIRRVHGEHINELVKKRQDYDRDSRIPSHLRKERDLTSHVESFLNGKSKQDVVQSLRDAGYPAFASLIEEMPAKPRKVVQQSLASMRA